ncbi:hypothetical protein N7444_001567 [Penicillium canescens]|nr:hypothetical protein N7444_001567 [Penicillium canescens]
MPTSLLPPNLPADHIPGAWFHFLCKSISLKETNGSIGIFDPRCEVPRMEHADWTWIRSGFFLRWNQQSGSTPQATLLCFEASSVLKDRLRRFSFPTLAAGNPFSLFVIVLNDLARQMDLTVWDVCRETLRLAEDRQSFTGLHNVAKHVIHLQEGSSAVLFTLKKLSARYYSLLEEASDEDRKEMGNTASMLTQVEARFETVDLRLRSLEKRMQNVIALSFHLVTQEGNRIMQSDSNAMATIAFMTLIFLPITTISTIFGSQFFERAPDGSFITVSRDFWVFWVISIPVTVTVIYIWYIMNRRQIGLGAKMKWDLVMLAMGNKEKSS